MHTSATSLQNPSHTPMRYQATVVIVSDAYVHMLAIDSQNWSCLSIEKLSRCSGQLQGFCADASDVLAEPKVPGQ